MQHRIKMVVAASLAMSLAWAGVQAADKKRGPACNPTDICYTRKGSTLLGGEYAEYAVRCSNGKKYNVVNWKKINKWCMGVSSSTCITKGGQMDAAKMACGQ